MSVARFRIWPAALLALVGFAGAGAIATEAATSTDAPTCGPAAEAPAYDISNASAVSGRGSTPGFQIRLSSSTTQEQDVPGVCVTVDPALLDLDPANPNI